MYDTATLEPTKKQKSFFSVHILKLFWVVFQILFEMRCMVSLVVFYFIAHLVVVHKEAVGNRQQRAAQRQRFEEGP